MCAIQCPLVGWPAVHALTAILSSKAIPRLQKMQACWIGENTSQLDDITLKSGQKNYKGVLLKFGLGCRQPYAQYCAALDFHILLRGYQGMTRTFIEFRSSNIPG